LQRSELKPDNKSPVAIDSLRASNEGNVKGCNSTLI